MRYKFKEGDKIPTAEDIMNHPTISRMVKRMPEGLNELEQSRYIYMNLGKIFSFDTEYYLGNSAARKKIVKYTKSGPLDLEKMKHTDNRYHGVCINMARIYATVLTQMGIEAMPQQEEYPDPHTFVMINADGRKVAADIQRDLFFIQTHQHTRNFGNDFFRSDITVSKEEIESIDKKLGFDYDGEADINQTIRRVRSELASNNYTFRQKFDIIKDATEGLKYFKGLSQREQMHFYSIMGDFCFNLKERFKASSTYLYKRDPEDKDFKTDTIKVYSVEDTDESGKRVFVRYIFDSKQEKFVEISDEDLSDKIEKEGYLVQGKIPALRKRQDNTNTKNDFNDDSTSKAQSAAMQATEISAKKKLDELMALVMQHSEKVLNDTESHEDKKEETNEIKITEQEAIQVKKITDKIAEDEEIQITNDVQNSQDANKEVAVENAEILVDFCQPRKKAKKGFLGRRDRDGR